MDKPADTVECGHEFGDALRAVSVGYVDAHDNYTMISPPSTTQETNRTARLCLDSLLLYALQFLVDRLSRDTYREAGSCSGRGGRLSRPLCTTIRRNVPG